jgi:hypothetical protein
MSGKLVAMWCITFQNGSVDLVYHELEDQEHVWSDSVVPE